MKKQKAKSSEPKAGSQKLKVKILDFLLLALNFQPLTFGF
jgi:hypothetical protein